MELRAGGCRKGEMSIMGVSVVLVSSLEQEVNTKCKFDFKKYVSY